jgi:hypothetical protein
MHISQYHFLQRLLIPLMAELRTKHTRKQATDRFCFPLITGTRGIQGDHFRDRPFAELRVIGDPISNCGGRLRVIVCIKDLPLIAKSLGHVRSHEAVAAIQAHAPPTQERAALKLT